MIIGATTFPRNTSIYAISFAFLAFPILDASYAPDRILSESRPPMVLEHDDVNDFSPNLRPWLLCSLSIELSIDDLPRYTLTLEMMKIFTLSQVVSLLITIV